MSHHTFNPTILREYDIRGQIGKTLSEEDAHALGLAFGTYVKRESLMDHPIIYVGYDGRLSSPGLAAALSEGLQKTGAKVVNIGLGPTPMLYFSVKEYLGDAGIMVTGSHNPPDYNGFKMMLQKKGVYGDTIQHLGALADAHDFDELEGGIEETLDVREAYVNRLLLDLENAEPLTIGWDAGNGAGGETLQMLTKKLPGTHHLIYEDIDGHFPNHHPDPTVDENLIDLKGLVAQHKCDLGIAFDGDADRIGVVDDEGNVLRCDILMTLYASEILQDTPGAPIIGDVKCSQVMFDEIKKMGGTPVMWKTGHSLIKAKMAELNAPLAGELSGHIFFADKYFGFDDALYCAVRLINIVARSGKKLSELTSHVQNLQSTPEIRIDVEEAEKFDLVPRVHASLKAKAQQGVSIDTIDGVRVSTPDGWWLLRPSNTQSVLVARAESSTVEGLERLTKMAQDEVSQLGYKLTVPKG
ncbi:MAG: phosphomannomutase/phosphoglucomutase [Alphaproteobacteria bacterium]|nr:phosphomannomutase/phosphoglucomutase [Alphaproteobacteria bacterium]MCD8570186.1 phosphomannomutase/phosphoglucomutase [Alphaproteobacteria bacterium]